MKKSLRFYVALWGAKIIHRTLEIVRGRSTFISGKIALKICPDFIGMIGKPEKIVAVTGTNGKTTVSNMIVDVLEDNGIDVLNNRLGANTIAGVATCFMQNATIGGKCKKQYGVLEVDERSSILVYEHVKPAYLVVTNMLRDSIRRNAHTEFITGIINKAVPKDTILIENGDDLIACSIGKENKKIFFGIDQLDGETGESQNLVRDIVACPECGTKLEYEYIRNNHIGKAHCPNCSFSSPDCDYHVSQIDFENKKMTVNEKGEEKQYPIISNSIFNIYNMVAAISLLREFGIASENIARSFEKAKITQSRYSEYQAGNIPLIMHLTKGQNPLACSNVFNYVKNESGKKTIILIIDDFFDAKNSSENITWLYDCDFEFLNDDTIEQIIIGGPRHLDNYVRLLMAGVSEEKLIATRYEIDTPNYLKTDGIDKIFLLHDMYTYDYAIKIKDEIISKMEKKEDE